MYAIHSIISSYSIGERINTKMRPNRQLFRPTDKLTFKVVIVDLLATTKLIL